VDRHVLRVANRIGLVHSEEPEKVEQALGTLFPPKRWTQVSDLLILHGRRICRPTPKCEICNVRKDCDFFLTGGVVVRAGRATGRSKDRPVRTDEAEKAAVASSRVRSGRSLDRPGSKK
jgi:adenine-specific DNA glycosylase